jgi:hypothetical protein
MHCLVILLKINRCNDQHILLPTHPTHPAHAWSNLQILWLVIFIFHAASAVFLVIVATRCGSSFVCDTFTETLNSRHPGGYLVVTEGACKDRQKLSCFYGITEAHYIGQRCLEWNVFALIAPFE